MWLWKGGGHGQWVTLGPRCSHRCVGDARGGRGRRHHTLCGRATAARRLSMRCVLGTVLVHASRAVNNPQQSTSVTAGRPVVPKRPVHSTRVRRSNTTAAVTWGCGAQRPHTSPNASAVLSHLHSLGGGLDNSGPQLPLSLSSRRTVARCTQPTKHAPHRVPPEHSATPNTQQRPGCKLHG